MLGQSKQEGKIRIHYDYHIHNTAAGNIKHGYLCSVHFRLYEPWDSWAELVQCLGATGVQGWTKASGTCWRFMSSTCCAAVSSHMDFVPGPRFRDGELVVLSVGRLSLVSQVDSQLVLTSSCDLMQVGQPWVKEGMLYNEPHLFISPVFTLIYMFMEQRR